MLHAKSQSFKP